MSVKKGVFCGQCQALNRTDVDQIENSQQPPICGKCGAHLTHLKQPQNISETQFEKLMRHTDLPIVVDIYADWCGPCKMYGPIFSDVAEDNWKNFNFIKLDSEKNLFFSSKYQIRGIPATLVFKNGQLIQNQSGLMNSDQLQSFLNRI